jgi:hypothetical protein
MTPALTAALARHYIELAHFRWFVAQMRAAK